MRQAFIARSLSFDEILLASAISGDFAKIAVGRDMPPGPISHGSRPQGAGQFAGSLRRPAGGERGGMASVRHRVHLWARRSSVRRAFPGGIYIPRAGREFY